MSDRNDENMQDIKKFEQLIQSLKLKLDKRYENHFNKLSKVIESSDYDYTKHQILKPVRTVNANIFKYTMLKAPVNNSS